MARFLSDLEEALRVGLLTTVIGLGALSCLGTGMVIGMNHAEKIDRAMNNFGNVSEAPVVVSRIAPGYTVVSILTGISQPSDYMEVYYLLMDAKLGDTIQFNISSPGGRVDTMVALAGMMHNSAAHVIANVTGPSYSAAAMITLAADEVRMADGALLMYHDIQVGGISGERGRIVEALTTYKKVVLEFFAEYNTKGILTQAEIDMLFEGNEVYLTKGEVDARIKAHKEKEEGTVSQGDNTGSSSIGGNGISVGNSGSDNILSTVRYAH